MHPFARDVLSVHFSPAIVKTRARKKGAISLVVTPTLSHRLEAVELAKATTLPITSTPPLHSTRIELSRAMVMRHGWQISELMGSAGSLF